MRPRRHGRFSRASRHAQRHRASRIAPQASRPKLKLHAEPRHAAGSLAHATRHIALLSGNLIGLFAGSGLSVFVGRGLRVFNLAGVAVDDIRVDGNLRALHHTTSDDFVRHAVDDLDVEVRYRVWRAGREVVAQ